MPTCSLSVRLASHLFFVRYDEKHPPPTPPMTLCLSGSMCLWRPLCKHAAASRPPEWVSPAAASAFPVSFDSKRCPVFIANFRKCGDGHSDSAHGEDNAENTAAQVPSLGAQWTLKTFGSDVMAPLALTGKWQQWQHDSNTENRQQEFFLCFFGSDAPRVWCNSFKCPSSYDPQLCRHFLYSQKAENTLKKTFPLRVVWDFLSTSPLYGLLTKTRPNTSVFSSWLGLYCVDIHVCSVNRLLLWPIPKIRLSFYCSL